MEGGASGIVLGKVIVEAEEELEALSRAEFSPNVQADSDSCALSGAFQGCLNRPVTLNEVSNPGSDASVRVWMDVSKTVRQSKEKAFSEVMRQSLKFPRPCTGRARATARLLCDRDEAGALAAEFMSLEREESDAEFESDTL
eukprot:6402276-Pyramimonas_sp.AAC.1